MEMRVVCFVALVLGLVASFAGVNGHRSRKLSENKGSANSTVDKPSDILFTTPPPPPAAFTTTPTTPVTTPTTPVTTPTTPVTTPTTPVTTPTTPSVSGQGWCVARSNVPEKSLQVALDYACGLGGADCRPVQKGGQCYEPETVFAHASYAFNSYYQKNNMAPGTCDFGGNAIITTTNPSYGTCIYTSGTSTSTTPTTPITTPTTPITTPTTPTTPTTTPTTPITTPTTPLTPVTPTTPVYNSTTPGGGFTSPIGGITGGIPTLGPTSAFNSTSSYSGASSSFQYHSSLIFIALLSMAALIV